MVTNYHVGPARAYFVRCVDALVANVEFDVLNILIRVYVRV